MDTITTTVSIVITTKNRKEDLGRCLDSCYGLKGVNEILVFDDGSTDGTSAFVKTKFPEVSLYRSEESLGLINARTKCASLAKSNLIVSIDDDCIFQGVDTIAEVVSYFNHPKVAAVTIPVINVFVSDSIVQPGIGSIDDVYICAQFIGCAHALRKDIFLQMGGYYDNLIRQEEETDYCMRLYGNGYWVRIADCKKPILHYHSTSRNFYQISFYRARNQFILNYKNAPGLLFPFAVLKQAFSLVVFERKNGQIKACLAGFRDGFKSIVSGKVKRTPLSMKTYFFFKKLRSRRQLKAEVD